MQQRGQKSEGRAVRRGAQKVHFINPKDSWRRQMRRARRMARHLHLMWTMIVQMLTIMYERETDKTHRVTCAINEDSVNGLVSIDLQTSDRQIPRLFQSRHPSVSMAEAHLEKIFPKSAGWTKTVADA
jgi:hypothetical protein